MTVDAPSLRLGTWNLAGRGGDRQRTFLDALACDVLLLTEVPDDLDPPGRQVHVSEASIREGVRYAAVAARDLVPMSSPHPASAVAEILGLRVCATVLPWRSSGGSAPWHGGTQAERTASVCHAISELELDLWGGDWNHAMQGRDGAGSRGGRSAIQDVLSRLELRVVTGPLPAAGGAQHTIDHIAVLAAAVVDSVAHVPARDQRGRLSDHDAYVAVVRPPTAGDPSAQALAGLSRRR